MPRTYDCDIRWPTFSHSTYSRRCKFLHLTCIASLVFCGVGVAYFLALICAPRGAASDEVLLHASLLSGCSFALLLGIASWYLDIYNYAMTFIIYVLTLLLFVVLISTKGYIIVAYEQGGIEGTLGAVFMAFFVAGVPEEALKLFVYILPMLFCARLRTIYDLIFLGIVSGVSFATIENLALAYKGVHVALNRFMWCTASHAADCLTGCLILAYIKSKDKPYLPDRWFFYPLILLLPIILHGTYDCVIFIGGSHPGLAWVQYLFLLVGAVSFATAFGLAYPLRRSAMLHRDVQLGPTTDLSQCQP